MNFYKYWSIFINKIRLLNKKKHLYKIKKSKDIINKIKEITLKDKNYGFAKSLSYLKKVDPYIFEEVVLTSLENQNIIIKRNKSYSGDGGLDGTFHYNNKKMLIQCKRYSNFINTKDLKNFKTTIENEKAFSGFFIHTGKTNNKSKITADNNSFFIISGEKLIKLIIGENIKNILS